MVLGSKWDDNKESFISNDSSPAVRIILINRMAIYICFLILEEFGDSIFVFLAVYVDLANGLMSNIQNHAIYIIILLAYGF